MSSPGVLVQGNSESYTLVQNLPITLSAMMNDGALVNSNISSIITGVDSQKVDLYLKPISISSITSFVQLINSSGSNTQPSPQTFQIIII